MANLCDQHKKKSEIYVGKFFNLMRNSTVSYWISSGKFYRATVWDEREWRFTPREKVWIPICIKCASIRYLSFFSEFPVILIGIHMANRKASFESNFCVNFTCHYIIASRQETFSAYEILLRCTLILNTILNTTAFFVCFCSAKEHNTPTEKLSVFEQTGEVNNSMIYSCAAFINWTMLHP